MASYAQHCPLSKALEVLGDRWTLLIIRELMSRGPLRYSEIQVGLPGIASNLLANRLRQLEQGGVIARRPRASHVALTPRGQALRPVIMELGRWGTPLLDDASSGDAFRMNWLALGVDLYLRDAQPEGPRFVIQLYVDDEAGFIEGRNGCVYLQEGIDKSPDATLRGSPTVVSAVLFGRVSLREARRRGLTFQGDPQALKRLASREY